MKRFNRTTRNIGLFISAIVSVLINSHQFMIIFFDAPPPPGEFGEVVTALQTQGFDFVINLAFFFLLSFLIYELNFYILGKYRRWGSFMIRIVLSFILMYLSTSLMAQLYIHIGSLSDKLAWGLEVHYRSRGGMITLLMIGLSQMIYLYKRNQEQRIEVERLSAENQRSQYIALKNQIDPHFLFNSFNTLNGLIAIDQAKAQQYVQRLSEIFRYSLQNKELVTVAEEVEFAQAFGELMKIRYGEALNFEYEIASELMESQIMPFSLQLLIENAVKHNVITPRKPLVIRIFSDKAMTRITVSNPIYAKRAQEAGEGIGLANLAKRYELFGYNSIEISVQEGVFSVSLPIINS